MNTENPNNEFDFIAVGDIVIDAFIRLGAATRAHVVVDRQGHKEIEMPFGDKIPFEFAEEVPAVGNSANAAVSAARLGMHSALIANIGKDENGTKCLNSLKKDNVATDFVMAHEGKITNYHYVLWYKDERTILIKHEEFPYTLPEIGNPGFLYLSSVSEHALPFHTVLADYLDTHPNIKLVFQPGTYQMKWGTDALARIYKRTELFFCNVEEAERILQIERPAGENANISALLSGLEALGPKLPIITDGPSGAYTYQEIDGTKKIVHMPVYPDIAPPYERTGAGDAFASTFSVAYALGNPVETCLKWASINSMNVCQHIGAQKGLLDRAKIEEYIASAPSNWTLNIVQ